MARKEREVVEKKSEVVPPPRKLQRPRPVVKGHSSGKPERKAYVLKAKLKATKKAAASIRVKERRACARRTRDEDEMDDTLKSESTSRFRGVSRHRYDSHEEKWTQSKALSTARVN